jgi:diamine N-acetyltransferase
MLENKNIKLRALEPSDIDLLYQWENDPQVWPVSNTISPYSEHHLKEYLETAQYDIYATRQLRLVIHDKKTDLSVGFIDLYDFDPMHLRSGVGVLIGVDGFRGKGIANEAMELMSEYCFKYLKLKQLYSHVDETNDASISLFEKSGFLCTSSLRDWKNTEDGWIDVLIYQKFND